MNTYFVKVNERSGEYEYTDDWLVDAHNLDDANKQIHQIMLNYRGQAEYDEETSEYDYGEHISYVQGIREVDTDHVHVLRKYIMTLSPDPYGIFLDMVLRHQAGEVLPLDDWDQTFTAVPNHFDENEQFFETFGEELEFVRQQDPEKIWTVVEDGDYQYLMQGYHFCNRIKYVVTHEHCPEELFNCRVLWCEFDNGEEE